MAPRTATKKTEEAQPAQLIDATAQPKAEIVVVRPAGTEDALVRPAVSAEDAKKRWDEYIETCRAILNESDYMYYACGKKSNGWDEKPIAFRTRKGAEEQLKLWGKQGHTELLVRETKKRSAWDKLARFYAIDTPVESQALCTTAEVTQVGNYIIEKLAGDSFKIFVYQEAETLTVRKVSVLLRVVAPNGRTILGDGACSTSERQNGAGSFAHADHDIFSTAFTRAFNRGVSRCIGTGEVSAEEFESSATPEQTETISSAPVKTASNGAIEQVPATATVTEARATSPAVPSVEQPKEVRASAPSALQTPPSSPAAPVAEVPKAEIPDAFPANSTTNQGAADATPSPSSSGFVPAKGKFPERFLAVHDYLFSHNVPIHQEPLVAFLIFSVSPKIEKPVQILNYGKLDNRKENNSFNATLKALPDRNARMDTIERVLGELGREKFIEWAKALVENTKARGIFR